MKKQDRADIQQTVTNSIIARIEAGGLLPWQCPWTKTGEQPMPYNWLTKQFYSGINILILWDQAMTLGYTSNAWLTFKQAKQLGGNVRKGEKAVQCIFVKPVEVSNKDAKSAEDETKVIFCRKSFSLFNIEQVEGLEDLPAPPSQPEYDDAEAVQKVNKLASAYCSNTGVTIREGGNAAYYSPTLDIVKIPTTFKSGGDYAATLVHELIHSTGHKSRLDRFSSDTRPFKDFDDAYAAEEVLTECATAFVCAELGIQGQHEQHVSYIDSWLRALKADKTFIFKAAAAASKAHNYLMKGGCAAEKDTAKVA